MIFEISIHFVLEELDKNISTHNDVQIFKKNIMHVF